MTPAAKPPRRVWVNLGAQGRPMLVSETKAGAKMDLWDGETIHRYDLHVSAKKRGKKR